MKIELDPEFLRTSMDLWRQAVDMEIPIHDSLRMHFFSRRGELLAGFVKTAGQWSMVLNACKATGEDTAGQPLLGGCLRCARCGCGQRGDAGLRSFTL